MRFLNIKDSVNHTSRSESTIRRLVKDVQNSVKNRQELSKKIKIDQTKKGSQKVLISVDFLDEYYGLKKEEGSQIGGQNHSNDQLDTSQSTDLIDYLKSELKEKNKQIELLNAHLSELIARQKEDNILLLRSVETKQIEQDTRKKRWWQIK